MFSRNARPYCKKMGKTIPLTSISVLASLASQNIELIFVSVEVASSSETLSTRHTGKMMFLTKLLKKEIWQDVLLQNE